MTVVHTSSGYTGTVDEVAEARRFAVAAPRFRVASSTDWALSVSGAVNRTVGISAGMAVACGVLDSTGAADAVAFAANGGGSDRYDALLATWDWTTHTVAFRALQGTTAPPLINSSLVSIDNTKVNRIPGVQYDAVLGVVKVRPGVGLFTSGDLTDCRVWAGYEGYALTGKAGFLTMLDTQPGSLVQANDTNIVWNRLPGNLWGVHKWVGTDKTTQPMLAMRNTAYARSDITTLTLVTAWPDRIDHSGGLLTYAAGLVTCQAYGSVRVDALSISDSGSAGFSTFQLDMPIGGGSYQNAVVSRLTRDEGYTGSGLLDQGIYFGPVRVAPGDQIAAYVSQHNVDAVSVNYLLELNVTYV